MIRYERMNTILGTMKSFSKEAYNKTEILTELLQLQKELVELVFDEEHAANGNLKIWDVEKYLEQMSKANESVAAEELIRFEVGCKDVCNRIRAEISGKWGENKTFQRLESMRCSGKVIRNIELTGENIRTELDGVAITSKAIFIVEVKNTKKDIFIDEDGNYYRTGEYMRLDSNIGEKMTNKIKLLRNALESAGLPEIKIEGLVVFTNNRIEVKNHCKSLQTCFLGQLPYIIEEYKGRDIYTEENIETISLAVEEARCKECYTYDFDVNQFKIDFANILTLLEEASIKQNEEEENIEEKKSEKIEKDQDVTEKVEINIPNFLRKEAQNQISHKTEILIATIGVLAVLTGVGTSMILKTIKK